MRIKRLISFLIMIILCSSFFIGCNIKKNKNVIFVPQMIDDGGYWSNISESLQKKIEQRGYEYKMMGSEEWDSKKQAESLMEAVNEKPGAIVLAPIGDTDLFQAIKEANKKDIPIILIDSDIDRDLLESYEINVTTYVGPSNYDGGSIVAEKLSENLEKGSKVAIIGGRVDSENGESRCSGFKDTIIKNGMNVVVELSTDWSDWEAYANTKLILQVNPDIEAIFAVNNNVCKGVNQAVEELNMSVITATFDSDDDILKGIEQGTVICTFDQNNEGMAESVAEVVNKLYDGKKADSITISEGKLITKN